MKRTLEIFKHTYGFCRNVMTQLCGQHRFGFTKMNGEAETAQQKPNYQFQNKCTILWRTCQAQNDIRSNFILEI